MTTAEITADLADQIAALIEDAEREAGRPLTEEEQDSLIDEFLSGLDDDSPEVEGEAPFDFAEFCMEGQNAGKPGPCPSGISDVGASKKIATPKEATNYAKENFGQWKASLKGEEVAALEAYRAEETGPESYTAINSGLRKGGLDAKQQKHVQALDSAISKAQLPEPVTVFRAMPARLMQANTVIQDDGYSSTSLNEQFVKKNFMKATSVLAEIRVPAGTNAAALDVFPFLGEGYENEMLLPRGMKYRVVSFDPQSRRAVLEVVPLGKFAEWKGKMIPWLDDEADFAEPPKAVRAQLPAPGSDVGLGGVEGKKADTLLSRALREGAATLARLTRAAVARLLASDDPGKAKRLFTADELADLRDQLAAVIAPAELLGRARIAERAERGLKASEFAEFRSFDDAPLEPMPPLRALDYFKRLLPKLGVDPERFGPLMERQAFTAALAIDETMLNRFQDIIKDVLETGVDVRGAEEQIADMLDQAGVGGNNQAYGEMIVRTNLMESYNTGAQRQLSESVETFPWFMYANPSDGRSRPEHAARNGKFYPSTVPFTEVRGTDIGDIAQCRCTFIPIDKFEVEELKAKGVRVEESW